MPQWPHKLGFGIGIMPVSGGRTGWTPKFRGMYEYVTVWLDATEIRGVQSGSTFSTWLSLDANGNHARTATQAFGNQGRTAIDPTYVLRSPRTLYTASILHEDTRWPNGMPGVQFEPGGSPQYQAMEISASVTWMTPTVSIFIVTTPNGAVTGTPVGSAGALDEAFQVWGYGGVWYWRANSQQRFINADLPVSTSLLSIDNSQYVNSDDGAGLTPIFRSNKSYVGMQGNLAYPAATYYTTGALMIGGPSYGHGGSAGWLGGYLGVIHEVIIIKKLLTDTERWLMQGYLAWKWGIVSSSLPATQIFFTHEP